jgi:RNA polymerase sigma factor (TIGR02999 family)
MGSEPHNPPTDGAPHGEKPSAAAALFDRLYDELHAIAGRYLGQERVGHTLQPTALVHEAFVRLAESSAEWSDPARFRGLAARVMRHVLVDHAKARRTAKRGGGRPVLLLDPDMLVAGANDLDLEALDHALERLAAFDARKARVVELRFFGGLTAPDAATEMGVSVSTVESDWRMAKAWLRSELSRE